MYIGNVLEEALALDLGRGCALTVTAATNTINVTILTIHRQVDYCRA
jgi:hypothetical protein